MASTEPWLTPTCVHVHVQTRFANWNYFAKELFAEEAKARIKKYKEIGAGGGGGGGGCCVIA